ncbi:uncharacterized protein [Populus alba]|uniref:Uncharacterized protein n=2 Tax=Populus TaxID=3689 RepID=A0A4U5MZW9_POPAL|nr:mRNA 3'-end-processing protein rna-14-like isoform X2 [Populus alba]KAJ7012052.1 mRNA 3'-end-processing protein rna-14-like isoform X2 [Populus alba x Populus x berolinensis]TKR75518.1 hypothetical protein D5086_0000284520 [Populus alba]
MKAEEEGGLKLFTNKPKKAQLKAKDLSSPTTATGTSSSSSSSSAAAAASYKMGSQSTAPPPPPQPPKESFARRYKFLWPLILTVNLSVGAYLFMRTKKKDTVQEEEVPSKIPSSTPSTTVPPVSETPIPSPTISEVVKLCEPIREDQQRELFKWILEEKRKVKPKDSEERKRIDDEKAILKQFIRAKSIPSI